tara:strand:+ start:204 stop:677 length:474 start_codon:yes stop_codon:yes gene_type:complete
MNPLIKGAEQIRYQSPLYDPIYDDDDNVIDEECIRSGTDVVNTFIRPVNADGKPRYYRLRYPVHAKEHKRRWEKWLNDQLVDAEPYRVKVSKIGRRVLFSIDPNFIAKRDKARRRVEAQRRRASRIAAELPQAAGDEDNTWETFELEWERQLQEERN